MFSRIAFAGILAATSLAAQQGYLKTKVNPGRAGVFVDGKYLGPASNFGVGRKYALNPGEHQVKLVEPRYEEISTMVTIKAGKTETLNQTMKALPVPKGPFGVIRVKNPDKFAAVYINEKFVGHADEFNNPWQGLRVPAGEYSIRIDPANGSGSTQKVKVEADKTVIIQ